MTEMTPNEAYELREKLRKAEISIRKMDQMAELYTQANGKNHYDKRHTKKQLAQINKKIKRIDSALDAFEGGMRIHHGVYNMRIAKNTLRQYEWKRDYYKRRFESAMEEKFAGLIKNGGNEEYIFPNLDEKKYNDYSTLAEELKNEIEYVNSTAKVSIRI